ncbi:phytanoyl-CoA dioxygenase family protein [Streptomyces sp. GS7]|uniref:phytanoyl-CoA dioxygenase family protein n=1 Tax=Streptomyces sp. GS7 TaxID=2692234 RepID=UPI00131610A0|nr:phytanoyl-CoA dioxygenase family protein [Streptomyces sp. GS7]QHC20454.1 phytanoyl-CoA dioxygenase family protein [Streptomyces sp. GS7]
MKPTLTRLSPSASVDEVCEVLERDGGLIIENLVDEATLKGLWEDLGPALDDWDYGDNDFAGHRTKRLSSLFARTRHAATIALLPQFLGAARRLIQRPVPVWMGGQRVELAPNVQISATQVIQIWPDEGAQWLHRDDMSHLRTYPSPISRVQLMLAMSDFTTENGATLVVPGSHTLGDEEPPAKDQAVPAEMTAGSCLIWLGGTYHGGGPNRSDGPRTGLTISMIAGNMRQEENQFLAVPVEKVRAYPEEVQRLLGYDTCPPFLGWYESADPHLVLQDKPAAAGDVTGGER